VDRSVHQRADGGLLLLLPFQLNLLLLLDDDRIGRL